MFDRRALVAGSYSQHLRGARCRIMSRPFRGGARRRIGPGWQPRIILGVSACVQIISDSPVPCLSKSSVNRTFDPTGEPREWARSLGARPMADDEGCAFLDAPEAQKHRFQCFYTTVF